MAVEDFTPQYSKQTPVEPIGKRIPKFNPSSLNLGEASTSQTRLPTGEQTVFEAGFKEHVEASWKWICDLDERIEKGKKQTLESANFKSTNPEDKPFKVLHTKRQKIYFERNNCSTTVMLCGREWNIYEIPTPVCSCTGIPRKCYRWQEIGWQSTCCTANISQYPLPLLPGRGQIRLQGRRMGSSTFRCLLEEW
uniref:protein BASIC PENTACYSTEINE6-like n=1 Tax=Erigeron canadensis TaxID=72917 RepID=UPI001CB9B599|nr:protein BASIC PENTACYSTEINE6-like [Erigeron canadensis]